MCLPNGYFKDGLGKITTVSLQTDHSTEGYGVASNISVPNFKMVQF
jgi:hypothetical protein